MIRINLLSEGRRPVVARSAKPKLAFGERDPSGPILLSGIVIGLLVAGGWFYKLKTELDDWNTKVQAAQKELKDLDEYVKKVEAFKKKQEELNTKIQVIGDLTANQSGPVHLMDQVSRALPDLLWLSQMEFKGDKVTLGGTAFNTNAIAQLIENLHEVSWFSEPESGPIVKQSVELYNFTLTFTFSAAELRKLQGLDDAEEGAGEGDGEGDDLGADEL